MQLLRGVGCRSPDSGWRCYHVYNADSSRHRRPEGQHHRCARGTVDPRAASTLAVFSRPPPTPHLTPGLPGPQGGQMSSDWPETGLIGKPCARRLQRAANGIVSSFRVAASLHAMCVLLAVWWHLGWAKGGWGWVQAERTAHGTHITGKLVMRTCVCWQFARHSEPGPWSYGLSTTG